MGGYSMTMLAKNGSVFTCGKNSVRGQLGIGNLVDKYVPQLVTGLLGNTITQIAMGSQHVYVLTSTGRVYIWGSNNVRYFHINLRMVNWVLIVVLILQFLYF